MLSKYSLTLQEIQQPITQMVTKFGGQPTWFTVPQWPLSRETGEPMQFICQVALDPYIFGEIAGQMAYLFITDDPDGLANTFEHDGGENAVIIQPGTCAIPTQPLLTGPTLYKMVSDLSGKHLVPRSGEWAVAFSPGKDAALIVEDDVDWAELCSEIKIGGTPVFLQNPEFPGEGNWQLLLQLDSANVPFYVNFGDVGIGYAFLSEDGTSGRFLWQCL